jgi:hypothetical protein
MAASVGELYGELWGKSVPGFDEDLKRSLDPRSADCLYDMLGRCGIGPAHLVLDAGSRDAGHAIELARRFGCRCVAIDPVPLHMQSMQQALAEAALVEKYGRDRYEATYASDLWGIYQLLGKLCPTVYLLQKPQQATG